MTTYIKIDLRDGDFKTTKRQLTDWVDFVLCPAVENFAKEIVIEQARSDAYNQAHIITGDLKQSILDAPKTVTGQYSCNIEVDAVHAKYPNNHYAAKEAMLGGEHAFHNMQQTAGLVPVLWKTQVEGGL